MNSPFVTGQLVETIKGAKFWGEVVSQYRIDKTLACTREPKKELPPEWRVDVMAVHPEFTGTIHVYPAAQLRIRP
jgi:hypothetical protein